MLKKTILSILTISIIGGILYFVKNQSNESKNNQTPEIPKVEAKKFIDESTVPPSKTEEDRILVKRNYEKGLEFLKNREISKEEKRKEELALTIQYIRDLGFEIDEENNTVSPLMYIEGSEKISRSGYYYEFKKLDQKDLLKLNEHASSPFLLRMKNPIGQDFIVDYTNTIFDEETKQMYGSPKSVLLVDGSNVSESSEFSYSDFMFKFKTYLNKNEYMPDYLSFEYETKFDRDKKKIIHDIVKLRIDLDQKTGKKIYKEIVID